MFIVIVIKYHCHFNTIQLCILVKSYDDISHTFVLATYTMTIFIIPLVSKEINLLNVAMHFMSENIAPFLTA